MSVGSGHYPRRKRRGWPGGRHAVSYRTQNAQRYNHHFGELCRPLQLTKVSEPTAESMRPRAKSFIRSISQIEANRQKFSLSMTSEVRKCPKSAKSDQNSRFSHLARFERQGLKFAMYKWNDAPRQCGSTVEIILTESPHTDQTFYFWEKAIFFCHFSMFLALDSSQRVLPRYPSDDHISAILAARRSKSVRSSSDWPSGQPGYTRFCFRSSWFRVIPGYEKDENSA